MDTLLNTFLGLVEEQTSFYGALLLSLQREKHAVVHSRLDDLSESSKEKESIILKIRILEEQRVTLLKKLAHSLGCPSEEVTLTQLSKMVKEPHATRLRKCSSNLSALIQSIQEINETNRSLLAHSIEVVRGSLTLMHNLMTSNPTYQRTGTMEAVENGGSMLSGKI
jgi:flagellar biosynthesis/type III secretory pathway chaperone